MWIFRNFHINLLLLMNCHVVCTYIHKMLVIYEINCTKFNDYPLLLCPRRNLVIIAMKLIKTKQILPYLQCDQSNRGRLSVLVPCKKWHIEYNCILSTTVAYTGKSHIRKSRPDLFDHSVFFIKLCVHINFLNVCRILNFLRKSILIIS